MFVYAIPSRSGFRNCEEATLREVEIFSDSPIQGKEFDFEEFREDNSNGFHYHACLDSATLRYVIELDDVLSPYSARIADSFFDVPEKKLPEIMGIVNMTPDSFYRNSRFHSSDLGALDSIIENSDIVDIGGESTRPGSKPISIAEEIERIRDAVRHVRDIRDVPISIDTMHSEVVEEMLKYEIDYVNDVTGFVDEGMVDIAAKENLKCVVMHMRGKPTEMMLHTDYRDVIDEITRFLMKQARTLISAGVNFDSIIIDPGIGFSKDYNGNIEILRNIESFKAGFKVLVGHSRKSFIGKILENTTRNRLSATLSASVYLYEKGIEILRVHDPLENKDAIKTYQLLMNQ